MKVLAGTIISIEEEEIKEAILGLLYKQKPELRPVGIEARPFDPNIDFMVTSEGSLKAYIHLNNKDDGCS